MQPTAAGRSARLPLALGALVAGLAAWAGGARAQAFGPDYTKQELTCMRRADKAAARGFAATQACIRTCIEDARKGKHLLTQCAFPFGGTTTTCLDDPEKGARAKTVAAVVKACEKDVPECYVPGAAATTTQWATDQYNFEQAVTEYSTLTIFCVDFGGGMPTAKEAACQKAVSQNLTRFWATYRKIYGRCKQGEAQGKIAVGACVPPATHAPTASAVAKLGDKVAKGIDKACVPGEGRPACHVTAGYTAGAAWITFATSSALDPIVLPFVYCGT